MKKILSITLLCTSLLAMGMLDKNEVKASEKPVTIAQQDVKSNIISYLPNGDFQSGLGFWTNNRGFAIKHEQGNAYLATVSEGGNFIDANRMARKPTDPTNVTLQFDSRNTKNAWITLNQYDKSDKLLDTKLVYISSSSTWEKSIYTYEVKSNTAYFYMRVHGGNENGTKPGYIEVDNLNLYAIK